MHNIQAAMQLSNQEKIMAYGMVTVDRSIRFMVQVRKYQTKSGEEKLFLCYPRKEENGTWSEVVRPDPEMGQEIQTAAVRAIQEEIIRDLHLPVIEDAIVTLDDYKVGKVSVRGRASVKICGLWIDGITIRHGPKGMFINMPQYKQADGTYKDLVYAVTRDLQDKISSAVLDIYKRMREENG